MKVTAIQTGRLFWLWVTLFILWLFTVTGLYYLIQKPVTPQFLDALAEIQWLPIILSATAVSRSSLDLLVALWILLVALGCGLQLLRWLKPGSTDLLEQALFAAGLGFGVLGLLTLGLGLLGLLSTPILLGMTVLLTVLTIPRTVPFLRQWQRPRPPRLIALYLSLALALSLTLALLPPTSWDALFYHLTGPRLYLEAGRIQPGIDIPHLNFPSLFQMLFLLAMGIRGDISAQLLHFLFNFLLAGIVFVTARRHLKLTHGWTAVLFLYAMPMTLSLAAWAYNDLALAFYEAAAVYAFLRWRNAPDTTGTNEVTAEGDSSRWLLLSGLCCGLAMSLKYTSFIAPVTLTLLLLWDSRRQPRRLIRLLLIFGLPALLVASPWYLKNWLFTGNPVYPFVFGGRFWNDFRALAYADPGTGIGLNPLALLLLPLSLTLGYDFITGLQDASHDGLTGPLFLAFLPFLILAVFRKGPDDRVTGAIRVLLFFALMQYLFWAVGVINSASLWQSRLLLPAFVVLCPVLARSLADLAAYNRRQFSLQRFAHICLGLVLLLGLLTQLRHWLPEQPWAYPSGAESRPEYLRRRLGDHYAAMAVLNNRLPDDAAVTFLWEPRTYYCRLACHPDSILDKLGNLAYLHEDAAGVIAAWQSRGVTHVLLWERGLNFVVETGTLVDAPRTDLTLLEQLLENHLTLRAEIGGYRLYALPESR